MTGTAMGGVGRGEMSLRFARAPGSKEGAEGLSARVGPKLLALPTVLVSASPLTQPLPFATGPSLR